MKKISEVTDLFYRTVVGILEDNLKKQREKDTIERIREQVKQWMPEKDGEEHTYGERLAFNSVLHLLEEMEEE